MALVDQAAQDRFSPDGAEVSQVGDRLHGSGLDCGRSLTAGLMRTMIVTVHVVFAEGL
jgi:hypothetical protein